MMISSSRRTKIKGEPFDYFGGILQLLFTLNLRKSRKKFQLLCGFFNELRLDEALGLVVVNHLAQALHQQTYSIGDATGEDKAKIDPYLKGIITRVEQHFGQTLFFLVKHDIHPVVYLFDPSSRMITKFFV